jgi:DNA polymerase-3 subunit alpha
MPDIDIDFDDVRRGEVIDYVKQKYGEHNVTQIITFGTMGAKGVFRDVGRALGLAFADVDRIAKMVPDGIGMTLERALELSPDLKSLPTRGPQFARMLQTARVLEGLARHASTHAAGVLITPGPLLDYVPLYRQKDETVTTQWDMKSVEKAGLLKMDFLGLRTLSVLDEAVRLVQRHHGLTIDLRTLALDDEPAYRVFQEAATVGIFQFESGGMREYLKRLKPTVFEDLVAMNALYRPGPMENIPYFIDCKHGKKVASFEHADLEPILHDTYGVFVYQEQVMKAANALAGFSMAQADELRRAMGKKRPEEMEAKRKEFVDGCRHRKITPAKAEKVFATMEKFAGYGFNKCVVADTEITNARTGERTDVGSLFRNRRPFTVHALGDDWKLRPRRVTDVVWNGRKPVFELRTAQGKSIRATANHPFRTLDGWKLLADLHPGDRIAAPRRLPVDARASWPAHEIITLAGLLSEGNTCHPTTLYFYGNDRALVDDFISAVASFPDTAVRVYRRAGGKYDVAANLGRAGYAREGDVGYGGTVEGNLALLLDAPPRRSGAFQWAGRLGILGKKATEKRVPAEVFTLADADLELFLGRLWAGDGYIAGRANCIPFYATSSVGLATDVQTLLLRLGIISGIHHKRFKYRGGIRPGYTVHLLGDASAEIFLPRLASHMVGRELQVELLRRHIERTDRGRTSKDTIPAEVRRWVQAEKLRSGLEWREIEQRSGISTKELTGNGSRIKLGFRRTTLARLATFFGSTRLARVAGSDVFWDQVVAIEPKGIEDTYDLSIEHDHNFVADGLIVHNSHSAAYALLAYQCAYLKAHYPAEFMAATLTSETSDSARIVTLIEVPATRAHPAAAGREPLAVGVQHRGRCDPLRAGRGEERGPGRGRVAGGGTRGGRDVRRPPRPDAPARCPEHEQAGAGEPDRRRGVRFAGRRARRPVRGLGADAGSRRGAAA